MKKIPSDPRFEFVSYKHTDIRRTFASEWRKIAEEKAKREAAEAEAGTKVRKIKQEAK